MYRHYTLDFYFFPGGLRHPVLALPLRPPRRPRDLLPLRRAERGGLHRLPQRNQRHGGQIAWQVPLDAQLLLREGATGTRFGPARLLPVLPLLLLVLMLPFL